MTVLRVLRYSAWGTLAGFLIVLVLVSTDVIRVKTNQSTPVAAVGGDFSLTDQDGAARNWADFRGKASAVFFGFTQCPEICPTTLWELSERMKALGPRADGLNVVFISVDPERDKPEVLKRYMQSFDPRIVALTGSEAETDKAVAAFKAYRKKVPTEGGDYTMDHTALVFLFRPDGQFVSTLDRHETAEAQMQKIERVLE